MGQYVFFILNWPTMKVRNCEENREKLKCCIVNNVIIYKYYIPERVLVCKYYIPERVIVRNVTLRNIIINRSEAEADNHIPKGDISDYHPLRNVILILLYRTFFSLRRKSDFA